MACQYGVPLVNIAVYLPYNCTEYVASTPKDNVPSERQEHTRENTFDYLGAGVSCSPREVPPRSYNPNIEHSVPQYDIHASHPDSTFYPRTSFSKQSRRVYVYDEEAEYMGMGPTYLYGEQRAPLKRHGKKRHSGIYSSYGQEQMREEQSEYTRPRSSSTTEPRNPKSATSLGENATEEDAIRAGIPASYSIKHWDSTERPIILLGSVFDANSLGRWMYDWTVHHHGASTPMADMAGDLWLLLIKLAGKIKRAQRRVNQIRNVDEREMVGDFIDSGNRLWERFQELLKRCEHYMLQAAKRDGTKAMGRKAGTAFDDSIFGRDRYLESTEKIMSQVRVWNMRFDVNCEETLRLSAA
ncbi:hypothetical protein LTR10_024317 [Elasticomyces elasticus]|uniref:Vegetative cell wall protein gp1 n=1 Tax=Exophiala sideris TaxID=1016849 RepID=A0ABR0IUU8_9EURO|nr:hypothetical protein LTR10_024317 [Elasticomyces elasticus]KAK5020749.1 hypothetical protein LTS07_011457 [Exophiala sideris]KAK5022708.1 hypothetical protein LTR13_011424 [Exophiala sideris]KAK5048108.1 hypothetical protein LTR69_011459 [Exophiala sideris]KAK5175991.1 hypothetical protein LTR44_011450 [Eurotiomycetes sp. CCFEE 6388]